MGTIVFSYLHPQYGTEVRTTCDSFTTKPTTPSLCFNDGTSTKYCPLILPTGSVTIGGYKYSYDSSLNKTLHCFYNGSEYVYPNKKEAAVSYNIPAGTYGPSSFESLISNYISNNGSRTVKNAFTVKVNGQTVSVAAGTTLYYVVLSSSPLGYLRSVGFGESGAPILASCSPSNGFTLYKKYVTYNKGGGYTYTKAFSGYSSCNITIGTGINFN